MVNEFSLSSSGSGETVQLFVSYLRALKQSDLTRKGQVRQNRHTPMRVKKPSCSTNPKSISPPAPWARDFQEVHIVMSVDNLFSSVQREELSTKLSII